MNNRDELIINNLPFVRFIIKKHFPTYVNDDDIIQIGCIGLVNAANTYDKNCGITFQAYAAPCIRNEIRMHFRRNQNKYTEVSFNEPVGDDSTLEDVLVGDKDIDFFDLAPLIRKLTKIERDYLILAMKGLRRTDIAREMKVSKTYVSRVFNQIHKKWDITYKERT